MTHAPITGAPAVLHLIDTGGPGGAETVFAHLATGVCAGKVAPIAVVPREDWLSRHLRSLGVEPLILPARGSLNAKYLRRLIGVVREHRVRLIHTHLLGSAVYGALLGLITRTPVLSVFHGPTDLRSLGRFGWAKRWLVTHGAASIVAVSTSTHEALRTFGVDPDAITLIQNGVDTALYTPGTDDSLRSELGLNSDDLLVGAIGNIRAPKAYDVLLRTAAIVLQHYPRAFFAVIGEGNAQAMEPLAKLQAELGIGARLKFLGFRKSTAALFRNFDLFVSSSRSEGLSLSFLEAMATGRAIVATRSGGPQEAIEDGVSGILTPIEDPAALAAALERALASRELRVQLGEHAREVAVARFSLAATVAKYEALYDRLLWERLR
jgi:glycosyltransferase involved in cell wall biosynthesis